MLDIGGIKTIIDEKIAPSVQNIVIDFADTCAVGAGDFPWDILL